MSDTQPSWAEVISRAITSRLRSLVTAQVGTVVAWNRTTQTADVRMATKRPVPRADGTLAAEAYPVLADVPVLFLQGGGTALTYELTEGDGLLVIALQWSIRDWLVTGEIDLPSDLRDHHLAHAVAIPCFARTPLEPDADQATRLTAPTMVKVYAPEVRLGDDGASFAALASKVDADFERFYNLFANWTPVAGDGGLALKTAFTAAFGPTNPFGPGGSDPLEPTACEKVKIA